MKENDLSTKKTQGKTPKSLALVSLQAGCLTFFVAGAALLLGLWLDSRLGTAPRWTLILLIASAPLTFTGVFLLIRRALHRLRDDKKSASHSDVNSSIEPLE